MPDNTSPVLAVLFDYGNVLSGPANPEVWARMRSIGALDEATLQREYWEYRHAYDRGTHTGEAYWRMIGEGSGQPFTEAQVAQLIAADVDLWTDLNPPMIDWARRLQAAGVRTGILSNIGDAMADGILRKFDWIGGFDHCIWSHSLKLAKPELAIYDHAAEGLKTAKDKILFIDDRADNVFAARESGMQAIQYLDHAGFLREMEDRGLKHLLELA